MQVRDMIKTQFLNGYHDLGVWQLGMDNQLPVFIANLPKEIGQKLDFSVASLDIIEDWWLTVYQNSDLIEGEQGRQLLHNVAYYFAKVFMQYCGGSWSIEHIGDDKPTGTPMIVNFKYYAQRDRPPMRPFSYVIASLDDRTGTLLSKMARNYCRQDLTKPS